MPFVVTLVNAEREEYKECACRVKSNCQGTKTENEGRIERVKEGNSITQLLSDSLTAYGIQSGGNVLRERVWLVLSICDITQSA